MPTKREDGAPWRNFYGRRSGKALRPRQIRHLETTLKDVAIGNVSWTENPERHRIDPGAIFDTAGPIWLEIGFGSGEHVLEVARSNSEARILACEPFINGVATLLPKLSDQGIGNVRVHAGDARDLFDVLPDACLSRIYLLYPDPWPKARHHRRRFVNTENIDVLWTRMKEGAELRIATDIPDYVRHSLEVLMSRKDCHWCAERARDWREPWSGWFSTRYEQKALREGRTPHYLAFRKTSSN